MEIYFKKKAEERAELSFTCSKVKKISSYTAEKYVCLGRTVRLFRLFFSFRYVINIRSM